MKKTIATGMFCTFMFVLVSTTVFAQNNPFSVSFSGGPAYLPLSDVVDFTQAAGRHISDAGRRYISFEKDDPGSTIDIKIAYRINNWSNIALHAERISIGAKGVSNHFWIGGILASVSEEWKFSAFPVGVSYELVLADRNSRFLPVAGIGTSLYISRMTRTDKCIGVCPQGFVLEGDKDNQAGYGVQVYFELQSSLNSTLYVNSRLRGRIAHGLTNTDFHVMEEYDVDFTGIDFTLGFGWRF
ncbi:outer membrane beta-barrel protein [candidate division KSB1 bacterium]